MPIFCVDTKKPTKNLLSLATATKPAHWNVFAYSSNDTT